MSWLLLFKTLHIIGFVSWFAGLFYLVRLFIYQVEALARPEPERSILLQQLSLMAQRLYRIITTPAMGLTWLAGLSMIGWHGLSWLAQNQWLHIKLVLLVLLTAYHFSCGWLARALQQAQRPMSSLGLRLYNEVPTFLLIAIVSLAVFRHQLHLGWFIFAWGGLAAVVWYFARKQASRTKQRKTNHEDRIMADRQKC